MIDPIKLTEDEIVARTLAAQSVLSAGDVCAEDVREMATMIAMRAAIGCQMSPAAFAKYVLEWMSKGAMKP